MKTEQLRTAIYARVSSDRQAEEGTIESQVADLTERVQQDGYDPEECVKRGPDFFPAKSPEPFPTPDLTECASTSSRYSPES